MEQEVDNVQVRVISKQTVKASLSPSCHPTTFTLSFIDQTFPFPFHIPLLLFYTATSPPPQGGRDVDVINGLKASLSQTLDQFYPLAGRLLDESTILCNDQGLPFIETKVDCHLSSVLTSPHKLKLLTKFLPPTELRQRPLMGPRPISELVPLAFQINVFMCSGVVIGCYMLHKLLDATSLGTFFEYWFGLASTQCKDIVQPDFEATVKAFPPLPQTINMSSPCLPHDIFQVDDLSNDDDPITTDTTSVATVVKSFVFDTSALRKLKARASSEQVREPTTFEAVAGFVWEQCMATASTSTMGAKVEYSSLSIAVNMRPRLSPPLPRQSMGNLVTIAWAKAHSNTRQDELVKDIHLALSQVNQKITTVYQGQTAVETIWSETIANVRDVLEYNERIFRLTSWCKAGFSDADFGFGKPVWIVPTDGKQPPPTSRNLITLTDYRHPITGDHGIEAWLCLEETQMQYLLSNPHFLAFVSPN